MTDQRRLPVKHAAYRTFVRPYARFVMFVMVVCMGFFAFWGSQWYNLNLFAQFFAAMITGFGACALIALSGYRPRNRIGQKSDRASGDGTTGGGHC
jgi:hypothetical protein